MTHVESAWPKHPDYEIGWTPIDGVVSVWSRDTLLARSSDALRVTETAHRDVVYIPEADVRLDELFTETDHHTICPFKGEASYWSLTGTDELLENVVWTYKDPMDEVKGIAGHVAFYEDRVRIDIDRP